MQDYLWLNKKINVILISCLTFPSHLEHLFTNYAIFIRLVTKLVTCCSEVFVMPEVGVGSYEIGFMLEVLDGASSALTWFAL